MARKLFIGGLGGFTTANDVCKAFKTFGVIKDVKLVVDVSRGVSKGYGLIEFEDDEEAREAARAMNGKEMFGSSIRVTIPRIAPSRVTRGHLDRWAKRYGYSGAETGATLSIGRRSSRFSKGFGKIVVAMKVFNLDERGTSKTPTDSAGARKRPTSGTIVPPGAEDYKAASTGRRAKPRGWLAERAGSEKTALRPKSGESSGVSPAESLDDRAMNVWIEEMQGKPRKPLSAETRYTAAFNVGDVVDGSLIDEKARVVPLADVPAEGLATNWIISSSTVRMEAHPGEKDVTVEHVAGKRGAPDCWTARFALLIPREGDTPIRRVGIFRAGVDAAGIDIVVMTAAADAGPHARAPEIYREIHVDLDTGGSKQFRHTPAAHLELRPKRELFTPPETLSVLLYSPWAHVDGTSNGKRVTDSEQWTPSVAELAQSIQNVRTALEALRAAHQDYFNAIDEKELIDRWINAMTPTDWWVPRGRPAKEHLDRWHTVAKSREMWELAKRGFLLHKLLFRAGSKLRGWIDGLKPGARVNFNYMKGATEWISHVPWALCFRNDPPPAGSPIDATDFLGIRLRISYVAHPVEGSKALGERGSATLASVLYWGNTPGDETAEEAMRQRASLPNDWGRSPVMVPRNLADRKRDLLAYLHAPDPSPVALVYVFCQCKAIAGADPSLRFDASPDPENVVDTIELPGAPLTDKPIVFLNACDTAAADAYSVNRLEQAFFDRECRAFIGSECKVPIQLAGRFATLFFRNLSAPTPASAGESFAQARRFLWDEYRNLGGLFYAYVNQYELFLGSDAEVAAMRTS